MRTRIFMNDEHKERYVPAVCHVCGKKGRRYKDTSKYICESCVIKRHRAQMNSPAVLAERARSNKKLRKYGESVMRMCEMIYRGSHTLDTTTRDMMADGLAYLVRVAEDCFACSDEIEGDAFNERITKRTAAWFRGHGYVEWYCQAAASGFMITNNREWTRRKKFHHKSPKKAKGGKS
jgi:hypothetical protein